MVESMIRYSKSGSSDIASNIRHQTPLMLHRLKRRNTLFQSAKLSKLGEDITETLEVIPRQWKVIQTVREKFSCRNCETITQPPAPFHVTPRGFAGPNLLAMILFEKFGQQDRK